MGGMRIALVTETYPPEVNGVAMTLERLATGLAQRGHHLDIVRPNPAKAHRDETNRQSLRRQFKAVPRRRGQSPGTRDPGSDAIGTEAPGGNASGGDGSGGGSVRQLIVPGIPIPQYPRLRFGLPAYFKLRGLWGRERPDVVHVATEGPLGLTALFAARGRGIPVTSSFHTNFHHYGRHYNYGWAAAWLMAYFRFFHKRTACTLVPSLKTRDELAELGFVDLAILERGVDTELFGPHRRDADLRRQWGCPEQPDDAAPARPVVCYVGRVAEEKNVPLTVRAFELLRARIPEARMLIVGDGPALPRLQREHPDFIFAGMRRGEDLARHYASADAFIFASTTETFGNVVSEALASGLAVLTYDYAAGHRFIRDGHNGLLARYDDADDLLAKTELLAEMLDKRPAEATRMRYAARAEIEPYHWDRIVARFESILRGAAERHGDVVDEPDPTLAADVENAEAAQHEETAEDTPMVGESNVSDNAKP